LLKATFPEGPFHLSVFNYVKWILWEKEKWQRWWALTEGEVKESERERGKGVALRFHFLCQIHNTVSSHVRFIRFFFFLGWIFFLCVCVGGYVCVFMCVIVCPVLSGQIRGECGGSTE